MFLHSYLILKFNDLEIKNFKGSRDQFTHMLQKVRKQAQKYSWNGTGAASWTRLAGYLL